MGVLGEYLRWTTFRTSPPRSPLLTMMKLYDATPSLFLRRWLLTAPRMNAESHKVEFINWRNNAWTSKKPCDYVTAWLWNWKYTETLSDM